MFKFQSVAAFVAIALSASAATTAPDPLRDRLIADARALAPSTMSFDRAMVVTQTSAGPAETERRVDHWSGKAWTLVSVNGKPPSADAVAKYAKRAKDAVVPGYYRLGLFLSGTASKSTDAQGRTVYRIDPLPDGSVNAGGDVSEHVAADATVDGGSGAPFVSHLRIFSRAPFRIMLVAKVDSLETATDYARGADGRPVLMRSVNTVTGSQFGTGGTQRTEIVITNVRPAQP